ncbi:MAG: MBL fold metallo-hydrolase [Candidatus Hydrogenedentota bacterium]
MRKLVLTLLVALLLAPSAVSQELSNPETSRTPASAPVEPFRVFDNLHYVGIDWVSAWIIPTSDGLVLIDSLYGEFVEPMIENIRKLGFDPEDIKYCFTTHGHFDHVGGVKAIKKLSGARIGMADDDWSMFLEGRGGSGYETVPKDLVVNDGDSITLGDTTLKFYVTPGHTPGVLSTEFTVFDNGTPHKAFMFGGVGLNFSGVDRCEMYIHSVERIMAMKGIEVNVPNHPPMGNVFERAERLAARKPDGSHPFVAPDDFQNWLGDLMKNVQKKLDAERKRAEN